MTVKFGAIRWDAYYDMAGPAKEVASALGVPQYMSRAPFFTQVTGARTLTFAPSQSQFDQEITFAVNAGIHHWAFLDYITNAPMAVGLNKYLASSIRAQMPWALMASVESFGTTASYNSQVTRMVGLIQQEPYVKVFTNRPLLYVYWVESVFATRFSSVYSNFKTVLDAVRAGVMATGLGDPYVVLLVSTSASAVKNGIGANALSNYFAPVPTTLAAPYAELDTTTRAYWAGQVAGGHEIVPICTLGWDPRPRMERVASYQTFRYPHIGVNKYVTPGTNAEIITHLQAAKDFIAANPAGCPTEIALIYAWNEHDEGGWLCPTLGDPTGTRLTAIANGVPF